MRATSLRWRLLLGAAIWIGIALIVLGTIMVGLFREHVTAGAAADLRAGLNRIVAQLNAVHPDVPAQPLTDPRYDLPYGGLYWQIEDLQDGAMLRSPSLFDQALRPDPTADHAISWMDGPGGSELIALSRVVRAELPPDASAFRVTLARDRADIDRAVQRFTVQMVPALLLVWVVLLIAAVLQVQLGLAPLRRLHTGLQAIRAGQAERLGDELPRELAPLTSQFNTMLAEQRASLEFARARAADLAHGLRTPLSALQATANRLRKLGDNEEAEAVESLCQAMTDRVDYQLRLAQLRLRAASGEASTQLCRPIEQAVNVLQKTTKGETLAWDIDCPPDLCVRIDRHDLIELMGVLLENAARHAHARIDIAALPDGAMATVTIADDGPGMTSEEIASAFGRGVRYDEKESGTGLGLAIAFDIAAINGGGLHIGKSSPGGLKATVTLPLSSLPDAPA